MDDKIHEDAISAWRHLCIQGGIELDGRDKGLDLEILKRLTHPAPTLQDALAHVTVAEFARAFFDAIHSYLDMVRDILKFFEQAKATKGKEQWRLRVGNNLLGLDHFREQIKRWVGAAKGTVMVPAIDVRGIFAISSALQTRKQVAADVRQSFDETPINLQSDVQDWITAYRSGNYRALPKSLMAPQCPEPLRTSATIVQVALERLVATGQTRGELMERRYPYMHDLDQTDALNVWTLVNCDHDYLLRYLVVGLAAAATHLSPEDLEKIGRKLDAITTHYPLRPYVAVVAITALETILSLPIWRKRNELYAVWIAT